MSKYTVELGELIELGYKLDLESYPIFNEKYRKQLNDKIMDHFYFREIGQETPDRFNRMLGRKMREIMPYYNQRYLSTMVQFDPLAADYFEQQQRDHTATETEDRDGLVRGRHESEDQVTAAKRSGWDYNVQDGKRNQQIDGSYQKEGAKGAEIEEEDVRHKTIDTTDTSTRTDDLTAATNNSTTTHGVREDNLTETTNKDTDRSGQEDVTRKETTLDTIDSDQTVTNNLIKDQSGSVTTNGTRTEQGGNSQVFAETPQNDLSVNLTMNQDGTSTTSVSGYATSITQQNERKSASDQEKSDNSSLTKDTGTVKTDGNSTENRTVDITDKKEYTETITEDGTRKNTGTVTNDGTETLTGTVKNTGTVKTDGTSNVIEDNTDNLHRTETEKWTENGTNKEKLDYTDQQTNDGKSGETEDVQNTARRHTGETENRIGRRSGTTQNNQSLWYKGRRGFDPSALIQSYRETFLNIDMEIIGELEPLFMSLW